MVKLCVAPVQVNPAEVYNGVTVRCAVTALLVELVVAKEIFPVPLAARPIDGVSFVQSYSVGGTTLVNVIDSVARLQIDCGPGLATSGTGLIMITQG